MFTYRGYLGWITDIATVAHPEAPWPLIDLDDALLADYEATFALQHAVGLDYTIIWGLAAGRAWPLEVESAVDERRLAQVRALLASAHRYGIRVIAGTGLYSWGFEAIIKERPDLSGGNPRALCASNPEAWSLMQRVIEVTGETLQVDGFSFQSADQGRCPCERCAQWNDVAYHAHLNARATQYVKDRWPDKMVAINTWGLHFPDPADLPQIVAMTRHADYVIDAHNSAVERDPAYRREVIAAIAPCAYGTVGGPFVEPPLHWQRTRWFLPALDRPAVHTRELAADGGQAMEIFCHILANPGDEVSVRHAALLLCDPDRSSDEVLRTILSDLYQPFDDQALEELAGLFRRADAAYFQRAQRLPLAATVSLEPLVSDRAGPPVYLIDHLAPAALAAYEADLRDLLPICARLQGRMGCADRLARIVVCLEGVLGDIALARTRPVSTIEQLA